MNSAYKQRLGASLAAKRRAEGINKQKLSLMTDISRLTIRRIENGQANPTLDTLLRISCALDASLADILMEAERDLRTNHGAMDSIPGNAPAGKESEGSIDGSSVYRLSQL